MKTIRDDEGLSSVLAFCARRMAVFWAASGEGPDARLAPGAGVRNAPERLGSEAMAWLTARFPAVEPGPWGWKALAILVGLWLDPAACLRLRRFYPGVAPGRVPIEVIARALDPTGAGIADILCALDPCGPLSRGGVVRQDPDGFLRPGRAFFSAEFGRAGAPDRVQSQDDEPGLPWLVPVIARGDLGPLQGLDETTRTGLTEVETWWRKRRTVLETWGLGRRAGFSSAGVVALFGGPPGTGKRAAAARLAANLDLPMWSVVVARMLSRYVGEAEARLAGGDVTGADEAARAASDLGSEGADPGLRAQVLTVRCACALLAGRATEAKEFLAGAREEARRAEAVEAAEGLDLVEAQVSLALGEPEKAERTLGGLASSDSAVAAAAGVDRLRVLAALGRRDAAPDAMARALDRVRGCPNPRVRVLGLVQAAQALWLLDDPDHAVEVAREALELARSEAPDLVAAVRVLVEQMMSARVTGPGLA